MLKEKKSSLVLSFYSFLKNPNYLISEPETEGRLWTIFRLWTLVLLVIVLTEIPISILISFAEYDQAQNLIFNLLSDTPLYLIIFLFYFWAPLSEEIAFRMGLKYSPYNLSFSVAILLLIIFDFTLNALNSVYPQISVWLSGIGDLQLIISCVAFVLFFGFGSGFLLKRTIEDESANKWYGKKFNYIFYASSLFFGIAHISNYYNLGSHFYILPLLIWPQFVIGLALGYIRMIYNVKWSIFMHFFHNFVFSAPFLAIAFLSDNLTKALDDGKNDLIENIVTELDASVLTSVSVFSFLIIALILVSWLSLWQEYRAITKKTKTLD